MCCRSVGCSTDVVQVLDKDCSGRHSCKVNTRDLMVSGMKPCPKDLRNYLEAKYICLPGLPTTFSQRFCVEIVLWLFLVNTAMFATADAVSQFESKIN